MFKVPFENFCKQGREFPTNKKINFVRFYQRKIFHETLIVFFIIGCYCPYIKTSNIGENNNKLCLLQK